MAFYPITVNTPDDAEPHIYAEDDAAIFQSIFGEDGIFSIGSKLNIEVKTNNLVRVNDGVICVGGHIGRVKYADYIDLTIDNGETGYNRNDLIIGSLSNTGEHTIDTMDLSVIKGTPSEGEAEDPETVSGNLYKGDQLRQVPIARVKLEGLNITGVDMLLDIIPTVKEMDEALAQLNANYIVEEGENDNGHYRKWSNGTLEMWGSYQGTFSIPSGNVVNGIYYSSDRTIPFPVESKTTTYVVATIFSNGIQWLKTSTSSTNRTGFNAVILQPTGTNPTLRVHWRATGAWK